MANKHKNLNDYFKAARAQKPPLTLEAIQAKLQQVPTSGTNGVGTGQAGSFHTLNAIKMTVAGIIGTAAVVGAFLWNNHQQQEQQLQEPPVKREAAATFTTPAEQVVPEQTARVGEPVVADTVAASRKGKASATKVQKQATQPTADPGNYYINNKGDTIRYKVVDRNTIHVFLGGAGAKEGAADSHTISEKVMEEVTVLELQDEVLANLGIGKEGNMIYYEHFMPDGAFKGKMSSFRYNLTGKGSDQYGRVAEGKEETKAKPVYITRRRGTVQERMHTIVRPASEKLSVEFNDIINTLVPVLVKATGDMEADVLLWFKPTEDFLQLLPYEIARDINHELRLLAQEVEQRLLEQLSAQPQQAEKPQFKYLESGHINSGFVSSFVVFPNPASTFLKLTATLRQDNALQVRLVDTDGRLVSTLMRSKRYKAGLVEVQFDIQQIPPGLYLLLLETASGDRLVQRILKE